MPSEVPLERTPPPVLFGGERSDIAAALTDWENVPCPRCGTLPDFGNFRVSKDEMYDRYKGVTELMPFAKAVSAKSYSFDDARPLVTIDRDGIHDTDYLKMMKIVLAAGYHGHVGIEYEGEKLGEAEGIKATKKLLERVLAELSKA